MSRFTTSDGIGIAYQLWGPESATDPVVLQHGFAVGAQQNWVGPGIVDALTRAGHRVLTLDARGHGDSDKPHASERYGEPRMARDLIELTRALGFGAYALVGYSMGAVIAALAACEDRRIQRLVLGGIGATLVENGGVDTVVLPNELLADALERDEAPEDLDPRAHGMRRLIDTVGGDRLALAAHLRVVHAGAIPFERIRVPALLLAGDADPLARRPEVLQAALPEARLVRVAGDHMSTLRQPELLSALLDFLRA